MTILFDASRPVKTSPRFGRGLLRSLPVSRQDHTAADAAWWAAESARLAADLDRQVDELFAEREAIRLTEAGLATW